MIQFNQTDLTVTTGVKGPECDDWEGTKTVKERKIFIQDKRGNSDPGMFGKVLWTKQLAWEERGMSGQYTWSSRKRLWRKRSCCFQFLWLKYGISSGFCIRWLIYLFVFIHMQWEWWHLLLKRKKRSKHKDVLNSNIKQSVYTRKDKREKKEREAIEGKRECRAARPQTLMERFLQKWSLSLEKWMACCEKWKGLVPSHNSSISCPSSSPQPNFLICPLFSFLCS